MFHGKSQGYHSGIYLFGGLCKKPHDQESDEEPPLGIILCAGKKQEQIELLELDQSGIHVAEYLTVLPPKEVLQTKLQHAIASARYRLQQQDTD